MATYSKILAWAIPWVEEHCCLQSMGSHWVTKQQEQSPYRPWLQIPEVRASTLMLKQGHHWIVEAGQGHHSGHTILTHYCAKLKIIYFNLQESSLTTFTSYGALIKLSLLTMKIFVTLCRLFTNGKIMFYEFSNSLKSNTQLNECFNKEETRVTFKKEDLYWLQGYMSAVIH